MNMRITSRKLGVITQDSRYRGYDIRLNGEVTVWSMDVFGNKEEFDHETDLQIEVTEGKFVSLKEIIMVFNTACKASVAEKIVKQNKD